MTELMMVNAEAFSADYEEFENLRRELAEQDAKQADRNWEADLRELMAEHW